MRKKMILMWSLCAAMTFSACTENEEAPVVKGVDFAIQLKFDGANKTRAEVTKTNAIPVTSWDIIEKVQFFLYGTTGADAGVVKFSSVETPGSGADVSGSKKYTYTSVPEGTYTLVAIASTTKGKMENVTSYVGTSAADWTKFNVLDKNISSLSMTHKATTFPSFLSSEYTGATDVKAFSEPAEIFMGSTTVQVQGNTANIATVTLKREVSLMRVRLNIGGNSDVNFAANNAILIRHLPKEMKIADGNDGGVSAISVTRNVQIATGLNTANPAVNTGYGSDATKLSILNTAEGFTMWKDIIVFPNSTRAVEAVAATAGGNADGLRRYLIAVSGKAQAGHILADGTPLDADGTVYWYGIVPEKFLPNQIREVNITLNTGGYTELPVNEFGDDITVSTPMNWDNNIVTSTVNM